MVMDMANQQPFKVIILAAVDVVLTSRFIQWWKGPGKVEALVSLVQGQQCLAVFSNRLADKNARILGQWHGKRVGYQ